MTLEQINKFEEPIFENKTSEVSRIVASEVFFRIDLSIEEFWDEFLKYIFKNVITKEFDKTKIEVGKIMQIKNDNGYIKSYIITKFIENEELELSTIINNNELIKIYVIAKNVKTYKLSDVWYVESKRTLNELNLKEHSKMQKEFNSKITNKVLLLKDYLLNRVRDYK